jgi:pteridine reductase
MRDASAPLAGQVAIVTGGGRRVGRAIAVALGAAGARVAVHYHASGAGAADTVAVIAGREGAAAAFPADLREPGEGERLVQQVRDTLGRPAILVNSAASMLRTPLDSVTAEQWDEVFALNLRAPFFLSLAAARAMGDAGGAIVNISDHMGFESWPDFVPHGVAKAAVADMTRALAAALAPRVRVNAVAPGTVLPPEGTSAKLEARLAEGTPLRRLGSPEDVAQAVLYFVGAPYVTGETLFVDGGRHGAR